MEQATYGRLATPLLWHGAFRPAPGTSLLLVRPSIAQEPKEPQVSAAAWERGGHASLMLEFERARELTEKLAEPLSPEDQTVQSMADASPVKWHRGHTTWFFETFVLMDNDRGYKPYDKRFAYLFNSYYDSIGPRQPRPSRGLITRPDVEEVAAYRAHVDCAMQALLSRCLDPEVQAMIILGINHEQQHQELLLMDVKHLLSCNPLQPAYIDTPLSESSGEARCRPCNPLQPADAEASQPPSKELPPQAWISYEGGLVDIGHDGIGFAFDNESPRHRVFLPPFAIASRPVTCGEWVQFIEDGGYERANLWLSEGWATVQDKSWDAPMYWSHTEPGWSVFTLGGPKELDPAEPVCHVSYYEADAFARWAGARLPTEFEWELAAVGQPEKGNPFDRMEIHPVPLGAQSSMFADVWQWTSSSYSPYPRFRPAEGAIGEYNGKFMVNQHVLRGGSCATPAGHARTCYRNFFPSASRWAFSGLRLAKDV